MRSFRSLHDLIQTFLQARRGFPTERAAAASIMFFAMFVAAVTGMTYGLTWLPAAASAGRVWWQAIGGAVAAALFVYGIIEFAQWCFGFGVIVALADLMFGALLGVVGLGLWAGVTRHSPPSWTNWIPLATAIGCLMLGSVLGRGRSSNKKNA